MTTPRRSLTATDRSNRAETRGECDEITSELSLENAGRVPAARCYSNNKNCGNDKCSKDSSFWVICAHLKGIRGVSRLFCGMARQARAGRTNARFLGKKEFVAERLRPLYLSY